MPAARHILRGLFDVFGDSAVPWAARRCFASTNACSLLRFLMRDKIVHATTKGCYGSCHEDALHNIVCFGVLIISSFP